MKLMPEIRILLVDDEASVRRALKMRLEVEGGLIVVGEAANGLAAVDQAASLRPDLVIMDVRMPLLDGIEATRRILGTAPETAILVLTMHDSASTRTAAAEAGAVRVMAKDLVDEGLLPVIRDLFK